MNYRALWKVRNSYTLISDPANMRELETFLPHGTHTPDWVHNMGHVYYKKKR